MERLLQDLRFAVRSLSRDRSFTLIALTTLALGMAATITAFTVTKSVLLDPLPFPDPDRLVMVWERVPSGDERNVTSIHNYVRWRDRNQVFDSIGAIAAAPMNVSGLGDAIQVDGLAVTAGFFEALGVRPLLGRTIEPGDESAFPARVVVLSYPFWQTRYGGARDVIGRTLNVQGGPREIVGVMPAGFAFPRAAAAQLYLPMFVDPAAPPGGRNLITVARMKPGIALATATQDMQRVVADLIRERTPSLPPGFSATVFPLLDETVGPVRRVLWVMLASVASLLLLACANVANLLLIRAAKRAQELAVRVTLGAGHWRLAQQLAIESLMLTLGAGMAALAIALAVSRSIPSLFPPTFPLPRAGEITIDWPIAAAALGVAAVIGLVFSLLPIARIVRGRLAEVMRTGARTALATHSRLRRGIVVLEVAIALVLVFAAALMGRSLAALAGVDPGFSADRVLTVRMLLVPARYAGPANRDRAIAFLERVLDDVRRAPGVIHAGSIHFLPLSGIGSGAPVHRLDRPVPPLAERVGSAVSVITDGYLQTMGIPLQGRDFDDGDRRGGLTVAIVNEALAQRLFPGENPIGRHIAAGYSPATERMEIVGVAGNVRTSTIDQEPGPAVYIANAQEPSLFASIVVRTQDAPGSVAQTVREAIARIDPEQGLAQVEPMETVVANATARPRVQAGVFGVFGVLALVIAAVGLYGVMAYAVEQRRREMGLRLALGAGPRRLLQGVVREGVGLAGGGAVAGVALAWLASGSLDGLLYQTRPTDPLILTAVAATLIAVAGLATLAPAIRATRVDPLVVLRDE